MAGVIEKLQDRKFLIWGYGREGKSTELFLQKNFPDAYVRVFEGKRSDIREERFDYIFKSPGIRMDEDIPKYTSQTELFLEEYGSQTIGITGTKGKSTTASMLYHVLKENTDKKVLLVGNIGVPCLDYFREVDEDTIVVFEMSCHQLAHAKRSPHVAVFLNLYEEHLDFYDTVDNYFLAKSNIARYQQPGDFFFAGENVPEIPGAGQLTVVPYDFSSRYELRILGEHNQYNADVVMRIATQIYGCDAEGVRKSMASFTGLPHRLQFVGEVEGVRYYDDSISTIPEAAIHAVRSVPKVGSIILGGMDRGVDYTILQEFIEKEPGVRFICAYEAGMRIWGSVKSRGNVYFADDLRMAVALARELTMPGEACVLSPAAASYGYFKNFEERGDVFKSLVLKNEGESL